MQQYTGMLKLGLFQVGFLNLVLGKGGDKSASTVSFDWKLLEACDFAQSKFNIFAIELSQNKFACISIVSLTSSLINKEMTRTWSELIFYIKNYNIAVIH